MASPNGSESAPILSLRDIRKTFGGVHALSGVSFELKRGEVHALVGENGAGKSTLIKIVTGAYTADAGTIEVDGVTYDALTPQLASRLGISTVYQEFNLLPELSVAENIFISSQPVGRFGLVDTRTRAEQAYQLLGRLGAQEHISPNQLVKNLTVGEQQIVEITKALAANSRILIMDEPSSVLPSNDMDRLYGIIRALRAEGHSIIYISHRLNEIFQVADRVTVLKDGQSVGTKRVADTDHSELVRLMVGRPITDMFPPVESKPGKVLLEVKGLCVEGTVFDVDFQVREGEVVGLAGLGGSGRTTVCRALVGLGAITAGRITYLGAPAPRTAAAASQQGLVMIPEDRKAFGLILNQTMRFNITLPNLSQFQRMGVLNGRKETVAVREAVSSAQIRPPSPELLAENLSGGNQQKVVLAKWLMARPRVVIFDEPTRGIDVGAKVEIYLRIRELTRQGVGVVMASSELPELLGMCDNILVFHEGRIAGALTRADATEEAIMHLATGTTTNSQ